MNDFQIEINLARYAIDELHKSVLTKRTKEIIELALDEMELRYVSQTSPALSQSF